MTRNIEAAQATPFPEKVLRYEQSRLSQLHIRPGSPGINDL